MITSTNYVHKDEEALREIHAILLVQRCSEIKDALDILTDKLALIVEEQHDALAAYKKADKGLAIAKRAISDYQKMLKRNKSVKLPENKLAEQQAILASKHNDEATADKILREAIETLKSKNEWRILITDRGHQMVSELPIINKIVMEFKTAMDAGEPVTAESLEALELYNNTNKGIPRQT